MVGYTERIDAADLITVGRGIGALRGRGMSYAAIGLKLGFTEEAARLFYRLYLRKLVR